MSGGNDVFPPELKRNHGLFEAGAVSPLSVGPLECAMQGIGRRRF
jgi:hypothetical protein